MAAFDTTRPTYSLTYGLTGLFRRIGSVMTAVIGAVVAWNDVRVTRNALAQLSDRELEDIGLARGDIALVVNRHDVYRRDVYRQDG